MSHVRKYIERKVYETWDRQFFFLLHKMHSKNEIQNWTTASLQGLSDHFDRQGTSGVVKLDVPLAFLHKDCSTGFPGTAEVMLTWSITMLVQPKSEQSRVIASSVAEVPWNLVYVTSLTFTAPACEKKNYKNKKD